jgi:methyl-accepting chemotaxis protein
MAYMNPFASIVTLSKRNNRYYGPTESQKIKSSFTEAITDLQTIYSGINSIKDSVEALASGFLLPSGFDSNLYDMRREIYSLEEKILNRIYTQANQVEIL